MSEKVKKIMWAVIDCSITKEQAMATLRIKYAWLYPYITPEVYKQHHDLYLSSNGYEEETLKTKCGCVIIINSREHNECRCDDDGENWICADCYKGEYDEKEDVFVCECCDSGLPAVKVQGIFVCKKCDNFVCGKCGKENEDPHCDIAWNEECGMCVCDCCE